MNSKFKIQKTGKSKIISAATRMGFHAAPAKPGTDVWTYGSTGLEFLIGSPSLAPPAVDTRR